MRNTLERILPRVAKPARYTGHEWNSIVKDWDEVETKVALAYPDTYEVGMSNLGLMILYDLLNREDDALAERTYAPWVDMEEEMRQAGIPLFSLESHRPLRDFDIIGFTLPYELNYTNVLNMLDLAGIPPLAAERDDSYPLVIGGGSCTYNPEPLADFFDLFVIGEGEEVLLELVRAYAQWKEQVGKRELGELRETRERREKGGSDRRRQLLRRLATIEGIYVPSFYDVRYHRDGTVAAVVPLVPEAKPKVTKRIVAELPPAPIKLIVPYVEAIHDRGMIEIQRGCTQGCRFCQAGIIYRPIRERPLEEVLKGVDEILKATGYEEIALLSLSSNDYSQIEELVQRLSLRYRYQQLSISLPSLRIDSSSVELVKAFQGGRRTGLTFAPEAGSQRLRDVINKHVTGEDLLRTAQAVHSSGWQRIKLYFMIGLPTETMEDVAAVVDLVKRVRAIGRREQGGRAKVNVSVATFVPKPQTPFQWLALEDEGRLREKQSLLRRGLRGRGIRLSWHDPKVTLLEAALSRGDRRMGRAIYRAWQLGAKFDAWSEVFDDGRWWQAFADVGLDPAFYARRQRPPDEVFPWDHIDAGVHKGFLRAEYERSLRGEVTPDCRDCCLHCGILSTFEGIRDLCSQKGS